MATPSLWAFSVLDFFGAIFLVWAFPGNFMLAISLLLLAKGIWSMISSLAAGFYYDAFGFLDFVAAIVLLVINFGTPLSFAWVVGIILAAKAAYTLLSSI